MTRNQTNSLAMYHKVQALFTDMPAAWENITPLVVQYDKLEAAIAQINEMHNAQVQNQTTGFTAEKNALTDTVIALATDLKKRLRGYAVFSENPRLLQEANISNRDMISGGIAGLIAKVEHLLALADEHRNAATDFNITPALITELRTAVNSINPLTDSGSLAIGKRTVATASLQTLFSNAARLLKNIDDLVDTLVNDAGFVDLYHQARKTDDRRGRSEATKTPNPDSPVQPVINP